VTLRPKGMIAYQETFVQRDQHRIYVRDHPGAEPAIILMHGFPDNVHLYDRLSPYLSPRAASCYLFSRVGQFG
jgi:haloalkane dehalogenase